MGGSSSEDVAISEGRPHGEFEQRVTQLEQTKMWVFKLDDETLRFKAEEVVGEGTFGTVYRAKNLETQEIVAIKRTKVPEEHESTETSMLHALRHRNVVELKHAFSSPVSGNQVELFIITELVSCDLDRILCYYFKNRQRLKDCYIMVYMYQLLKGLEFIHRKGVAHRDLKPSNVLINISDHSLKIADFGSARVMRPGRKNATYICSRYYRAPELLIGCSRYTTAVDMWSCGCIFAEMYKGSSLFVGKGRTQQLTAIEEILGTPTESDLRDLEKRMLPYLVRNVSARTLRALFQESVCDQAVDLIQQMLVYSPKKRIDAATALRHPFFNPIHKPGFSLPRGVLPPLFDSEAHFEVRSDT